MGTATPRCVHFHHIRHHTSHQQIVFYANIWLLIIMDLVKMYYIQHIYLSVYTERDIHINLPFRKLNELQLFGTNFAVDKMAAVKHFFSVQIEKEQSITSPN